MKIFSRVLALLMCLALIVSAAVISAQAADEEIADVAADTDIADTGADSIIIHVDSSDKVPYIYYWNALPTNKECAYPGVKMSRDTLPAGGTWYTYTFANTSKINFLLTDGFASLGIPGIFLIAVLFYIILVYVNRLSNNHETPFVMATLTGTVMAVTNVSLFTTILSCGFFLCLLLLRFSKTTDQSVPAYEV